MLKDITTVRVQGANFKTLTPFCLFDPHDGDKLKTIKGTLLYGRNGTGKSSIARAFRKLAGETVPAILSAAFYDDKNQKIELSDNEKKNIYVFDEEYVDKNVRLQQEHLETIVMLGDAADLSTRIEEAETQRNAAKTSFEQQDAVFRDYSDEGNVISPKHYIKLIRDALKGDDNWAGRDRLINNGRQNTSVRDDTYKQLISSIPVKPRTELILDFSAKLGELEDARTGVATIDSHVPTLSESYSIYDDEAIRCLLVVRLEKPELSEREQKLLRLVREGKIDELAQRLNVFSSNETVECPYCLQTITVEYKESMVKSIEKMLSKAVETHREELRERIVDMLSLNLEPYNELFSYQTCINLITRINVIIQENNNYLKMKSENPYEPITIETTTANVLVNQLINGLRSLEAEREEYNKDAKKTGPIIRDLCKINSEIAYYDVKDLVARLEQQQEEYATARELYEKRKADYEARQREVDVLEGQRSNVKPALDSINASLKYIFFADDRLRIEYSDGKYRLLSHGNSVKPCDVSVGERNIIGLCYFFTSVLEGKEERDAYQNEYLLVIDDPVSSYDAESRIGILSFLKYKLGLFLLGNQNTKVLLMTHDLLTFYDIHKIFEEIMATCKQKGYRQGPKFNRFEISNGEMRAFSYNSRHEYTEIVKTVYDYACGQTALHELTIGNLMRQALEAFSTFEYKRGIEDISTDEQILDLLPKQEFKLYYKNLMYRLVLHGGSHKHEQIKAMKDLSFFSLISENEKRRTARDILCFIYLLNERHLLAHLKEYTNARHELEIWSQDIAARAVSA